MRNRRNEKSHISELIRKRIKTAERTAEHGRTIEARARAEGRLEAYKAALMWVRKMERQ